jgi:hypothetical protein
MNPICDLPRTPGRRKFLGHLSAVAAATVLGTRGAAASPPSHAAPLPTIALGRHRISRLVAGWNPVGGHSHTTLDMARAMREWFTVGRTADFLLGCERHGISAWQCDHTDKAVAALRLALFSAPLCLMVAYLLLGEVSVHGPMGRGFGWAVSEASRDLR